jgi:hypothetical protein
MYVPLVLLTHYCPNGDVTHLTVPTVLTDNNQPTAPYN